jgi:hypothetical protein
MNFIVKKVRSEFEGAGSRKLQGEGGGEEGRSQGVEEPF